MFNAFYAKLALANIRRDKRTYVPHIIATAVISGVYLLIAGLMFSYGLANLTSGKTTQAMFSFGMVGSNAQALAMEPLGAVAGTASSVFGFMQTVGGAAIGAWIGAHYNGTVVPTAAGYFLLALVSIGCILIAEKGRLFGVGAQYQKKN